MGENEQGGMLRIVVVVGLIAIIAAVVIFAVTGLKNNATAQREDTVHKVERAQMTGKNLFVNSRNLGLSYSGNDGAHITVEDYDANTKMWHITSPQSGSLYVGPFWNQPGNTSYQLVKGDQYAFSFDIKGTGVYHFVGFGATSDYKSPSGDVSSEWRRVTATGTADGNSAFVIYFDTHTKPLDVYIKMPKLELGTVSTDYSE